LLAGVILMSIGFVRAERQRDAALAAERAEQAQRRKAERAHADAMAVLTFFTDTLATADPSRQGPSVSVREVLEQAGKTIGEKFQGRPYIEGQVRAQLGLTYINLGLRDAAAQHLPRAIEIYRQVTGPRSEATIDLELELASLYADMARYDDAQRLTENARAVVAARAGAENPAILKVMNSLASVDWRLGSLPQAEAMCRAAVDGMRRVLGSDRAETLRSIQSLGILCDVQERPAEAEPLVREAFEGYQRLYGFDHPDTLDAANSLALVLNRLNRTQEAKDLYERTLDGWKRIGGIDQPHRLVAMSNLAETYYALGQYDKATKLYNDVLPRKERVMGMSHPSTLRTVADMAVMEHKRENYARAAELWARVIATAPQAFPENHPIHVSFLAQSAETLVKLDRFEEAEANLLEAYRRPTASGEYDQQALARRLVLLYETWKKPSKAAEWRARLNGASTQSSR